MDRLLLHTPRFETSHHASYKAAEWTQAAECEPVGDYVSLSRKRFLAVVSPPIPTRVEPKTARRIILFDNLSRELAAGIEGRTPVCCRGNYLPPAGEAQLDYLCLTSARHAHGADALTALDLTLMQATRAETIHHDQ
jgi:hypothetical protein